MHESCVQKLFGQMYSPIVIEPHSGRRGTSGVLKALQSEEIEVMPTLPPLCQVGHDFPDDTAEFEPVAGEPGRETDLGKVWVQVEDEMFIGRVGEETCL